MRKLFAILFAFLLCATDADAFKFASGQYTGNGADDRTIDISDTTTPSVADFQPEVCIVKGNTTQNAVVRIAAMGADASKELSNAGAALLTNRIQAFNANGFQVGTNAQVNTDTLVYFYACWAPDSNNDFASGTYAGNGSDSRTIDISATSTGAIPDFSPEFVLVVQGAETAMWRGASSHSGDSASDFFASANDTNCIQAFNANGFEIGTCAKTNTNLTNYYYFAIKAVTGFVATGNYSGDGTDGISVTTGFQPEFVLVKGNSATHSVTLRFEENSGDQACRVAAFSCGTNLIESVTATTFTLGSALNESAVTVQWMALKTPTYAGTTGPLRRRSS